MPIYKAPVADTMFLLTDVFGLHRHETYRASPTPKSTLSRQS